MRTRSFLASLVLLVLACPLHAADKPAAPKVGDIVILKMTGEFAKEYATRTSPPQHAKKVISAQGISIETTATIAQRRADGKYRIEHSLTMENGAKPQMVTLTATVEPTKFKSVTTRRNTPIYASPDDAKNGVAPTMTKTDQTTLHLEFSDLREAKLRTWALVDEAGK